MGNVILVDEQIADLGLLLLAILFLAIGVAIAIGLSFVGQKHPAIAIIGMALASFGLIIVGLFGLVTGAAMGDDIPIVIFLILVNGLLYVLFLELMLSPFAGEEWSTGKTTNYKVKTTYYKYNPYLEKFEQQGVGDIKERSHYTPGISLLAGIVGGILGIIGAILPFISILLGIIGFVVMIIIIRIKLIHPRPTRINWAKAVKKMGRFCLITEMICLVYSIILLVLSILDPSVAAHLLSDDMRNIVKFYGAMALPYLLLNLCFVMSIVGLVKDRKTKAHTKLLVWSLVLSILVTITFVICFSIGMIIVYAA